MIRLIPSLGWMRHYPGAWLRPDVTAGLTAAAVVVPKAMAYATIAGLPLHIGLYTAIVPMVVYALLGTSRPLSVSTTTTIAILTAAELGRSAPGGDAASLVAAAATLAVLVGILLTAAGVLRLGFIANFISDPVLTGFKSGIGLVIVVDQLPKLLGVHFEKTGFFRDLFALAQQLPDASVPTLLLGVTLLVLLVGLEHFVPKAPAPLVAIAAAIAASALLGLDAAGVATVGAVAGDLPSLMLPGLALAEQMWPAAAGIALMSFTETIAAARAFGAPGEPRPDANQELLALGVANATGGVFGAMPAGGGTSQTAVNRLAGARTQVAELVTAGVAIATLVLLGPGDRPDAASRAGGSGGGLFARAHQAGGVRCHPSCPRDGVPLGSHRLRRRCAARHAQGHPGGGHRVPGVAGTAGLQSAGVRAGPEAWDHRLPRAHDRACR